MPLKKLSKPRKLLALGLVAVALGWLFYREPFGTREALAMAVIFAGVAIVKRTSAGKRRGSLTGRTDPLAAARYPLYSLRLPKRAPRAPPTVASSVISTKNRSSTNRRMNQIPCSDIFDSRFRFDSGS